MFRWVNRIGLTLVLGLTVFGSQVQSQDTFPMDHARMILESISGPSADWANLLAFKQEKPNIQGSNRIGPGVPPSPNSQENPQRRGPGQPNPGDNDQQRAMELRERQRQADRQRQTAEEEMRRVRESREKNEQRERMAQEIRMLENSLGEHQQAIRGISAKLEEVRNKMRGNQPVPELSNPFPQQQANRMGSRDTGPRNDGFNPSRPNNNQPIRDPFQNERRDPKWEELMSRIDRQMDKQNSQIRALEEQVRDLRNHQQMGHPNTWQHSGPAANSTQIYFIPVQPGMMVPFGNPGPNPLKPGFPLKLNDPNQGGQFGQSYGQQHNQQGHDPQFAPGYGPIPMDQGRTNGAGPFPTPLYSPPPNVPQRQPNIPPVAPQQGTEPKRTPPASPGPSY